MADSLLTGTLPPRLQATLDRIAEMATRLCAAGDATVGLVEGAEFVRLAHFGSLPFHSLT